MTAYHRAPSGTTTTRLAGRAELIQTPNALAAKVGPRAKWVSAEVAAKAEAMVATLSNGSSEWLKEEIAKLDSLRGLIRANGPTQETSDALHALAHDLKGLGLTYGFPLVTRLATSLCKLLARRDQRLNAPLLLLDAHITAIRAAFASDIRTIDHPTGLRLAEELESRVDEWLGADSVETRLRAAADQAEGEQKETYLVLARLLATG